MPPEADSHKSPWLALFAASALALATPALAGTPDDLDDPVVAAEQQWEAAAYTTMEASATGLSEIERHDAILERAMAEGVIPVIVRLKADDEDISVSGGVAARRARASLALRQQQVADGLGLWGGVDRAGGDIKRFKQVQALAMQADALDIVDLLDNPEVADVYEDVAYPPALADTLPLLGATSSHDFLGSSGAGQVVAVLDTGVDKTHPFLAGKVVSEACYSSTYAASGVYSLCPGGVAESTASGSGVNCSSSYSGCSHGTHVAGIVAGDNGSFTGVAKDAKIIAIQVFSGFPGSQCGGSPCAMAYTSDIIKGLERVYELRSSYRIAAANLSLGGGYYTSHCDYDATKSAIDQLASASIATVIASGNNGYTNAVSSPACVSSAITVGSTTKADAVSYFSNSAPMVDLLAPGSSIRSSVVGGGYEYWNGTSMATPHVAGAWAVMKSRQPDATVAEVLALLQDYGVSVRDPDNGIVSSRIHVGNAAGQTADDGGSSGGDGADTGTSPVEPAVPVAIAASTVTGTSFDAAWSAVTGASGYVLDVSLRNDFRSYVRGYQGLDVGSGTTWTVSGLRSKKTHFYRVRAIGQSGLSDASNVVSVTTLGPPPSPPRIQAGQNITSSSFTASWKAVAGADGYRLDVATDAAFTSLLPGFDDREMGTGLSVAVTGLASDTTYYLRARSYGASGVSKHSSTRKIKTSIAPPLAPVASNGTNVLPDSFNLSWSAVAGATAYRIDISTSSDFSTYVKGYENRSAGRRTTFSLKRMSPSTTYYYRVRAYNKGGYSPDSNVITIVTPLAPPAKPAVGSAASVETDSFVAVWSQVDGASRYRLDVATDSRFANIVSGYDDIAVGNAAQITVSGLDPYTRYYYRVRAENGAGASDSSRARAVRTLLAPPGTPASTSVAKVTPTSFEATWSPVSGATRYYLDVSTSSTFDTFVRGYENRSVGRRTSRNVTRLEPGTTYFYRARAFNRAGTSASSPAQRVRTSD